MSRSRTFLFLSYWLPVLVWMAVIFTASSDTHSYQHSSRLVAPVLHWLFPHISEKTVDLVVFIARKCAHLVEYSVFAMLVWRALRLWPKFGQNRWCWPHARLTLLIVFLYAASDEFHQEFVATRSPRVHDVLLDTFGGATGLFVLWLFNRQQKRS